MTINNTLRSLKGVLVLTALLLGLCQPAAAAALFTLKGQLPNARQPSEAEVRLSVLGWTADDKASAVVEQYKQFLANKNGKALADFLGKQETEGYVFTQESVGYTVKYAWHSDDKANPRMVLLIVPGLLTHDPYMWKQPNKSPLPFTLIELNQQQDGSLMTTSIDTPIAINPQGRLELQQDKAPKVFARLQDDTPYYLKQKS